MKRYLLPVPLLVQSYLHGRLENPLPTAKPKGRAHARAGGGGEAGRQKQTKNTPEVGMLLVVHPWVGMREAKETRDTDHRAKRNGEGGFVLQRFTRIYTVCYTYRGAGEETDPRPTTHPRVFDALRQLQALKRRKRSPCEKTPARCHSTSVGSAGFRREDKKSRKAGAGVGQSRGGGGEGGGMGGGVGRVGVGGGGGVTYLCSVRSGKRDIWDYGRKATKTNEKTTTTTTTATTTTAPTITTTTTATTTKCRAAKPGSCTAGSLEGRESGGCR